MFRVLAPLPIIFAFSLPALACPWAGGTFSGIIEGDVELRFSVDKTCTEIAISENDSGRTVKGVLQVQGKTWKTKTADGTQLVLNKNGKSVRASRGGAQRTVRVKKTK